MRSRGWRASLAKIDELPPEAFLASREIAGRRPVSEQVSDRLCRCDDALAAAMILANHGAAVSPGTLHWLLDQRPERTILEAIARRRLLPPAVGDRLRLVLMDRPGEATYAAM